MTVTDRPRATENYEHTRNMLAVLLRYEDTSTFLGRRKAADNLMEALEDVDALARDFRRGDEL